MLVSCSVFANEEYLHGKQEAHTMRLRQFGAPKQTPQIQSPSCCMNDFAAVSLSCIACNKYVPVYICYNPRVLPVSSPVLCPYSTSQLDVCAQIKGRHPPTTKVMCTLKDAHLYVISWAYMIRMQYDYGNVCTYMPIPTRSPDHAWPTLPCNMAMHGLR